MCSSELKPQKLLAEELMNRKSHVNLKPTTRQNLRAPIFRLPNEIIVEIFVKLKKDNHIRYWHQVTHVCRHWRHTALNASNLWDEPTTSLHTYALVMLERSRESTLSIHLDYDVSEETKFEALKHMRRIDYLYVESWKEDLDDFQDELSQMSADSSAKLKTLDIIQSPGAPDPAFKLSAATFCHATSLKTLWLYDIDIDWHLFPISTLTSLHLMSLRISASPSWTQFQDILRGMPLLEGLFFNLDNLQMFTPPHCLEPLELPLLRELEIHESHSLATYTFLHYTILPRLRYADFETLFSQSEGLNDYSPIIRAILSVRTNGDFGTLSRLEICGNHFTLSPNRVHDWADSQNLSLTIFCPGPISNNMNEKGSVRFVCSVMTELAAFPGNPASIIVYLSISVDLTSQQLLTLFGNLPRLETISSSIPSQSVINSLIISPLHPPNSLIPFPKLNTLILKRYGRYTPALLEALCNCLMMRCEYSSGLDYLVGVGYELTARDAQRLRELVVNFDVKIKGTQCKVYAARISECKH